MPFAQIPPDGLALYYELHGPDAAPVLVLNNGILMSTASWPLQVPALAKEFRVLLYDCRGQGQSDHPDSPFSMETHADDLAALLDRLSIGRAHVAGISYGGEVAQAFAVAYPGRVSSLFLADTVSDIDAPLRDTVEEWRDVAGTADPQRFFDITVPWNFSQAFIDAHPALMADARQRYEALDYPAVVRLCDAFLASVRFTDRLRSVSAPACVVVGSEDRLKGLAYAERIRAALPHAELHVIPRAGHASCWEQPEAFNRLLLEFLRSH